MTRLGAFVRRRRRALALSAALLVAAVAGRVLPNPRLREGVGLSQAIFDREGRLLRLSLAPDERYRLWVPLSEIHPALVEATLLHEDQLFRWHPGVNPVALARGAWRTYLVGGRRVGGSTLTMQLARIRYGIDSRTPGGKLVQVLRALELEWRYSKDEILEAYLNLAPYGRNVEGVGAASLVYFGEEARRLSLAEALTLSVVPQSPARRAPGRQGDGLTAARLRLFERWLERHPQDADSRPAVAAAIKVRSPSELPFLAPHFVGSSIRRMRAGASLVTALDLGLQRLLERHLHAYVERRRRVGIRNAAAMLVDWRTMEVRAAVGSADFLDESIQGQVNGTEAKRSPGSALKPFIYGLGFDQGLIHPRSMLKDAPVSFGGYNPENFDGDFVGPISVEDALVRSRNVPAVQVAAQLSDPTLHGFLRRAGISRLRDEATYGLSLVLGSAEVTMEELVELYAMLANGGELRRLRAEVGAPEDPPVRLLSPEAAFLVLDALESRRTTLPGPLRDEWLRDALPVAWKTGTSYAHRDAWTVGVFGPYVLAVWIGNFDGRPNPAFVGVEAAAPLMFELIDSVRAAEPEVMRIHSAHPAGVTRVSVCAVSGMLPGLHCGRRMGTWFIPGKSPAKECDIHREVWVDRRTGLRACRPGPFTRSEVYEFWPTDLLRLFRRAGLPRRVPPPDGEACSLGARAVSGAPPVITSPQPGVDYAVRASSLDTETVPLSATADADARELSWFIDDRLVGRAHPGETIPWAARPGRYVVRAVDDRGRAGTREVYIRLVP